MTLRNTMFDQVKAGAQKAGIFISYYPPPGSFERHLRDFLTHNKVNVVLDVGAYVGDYAAKLREAGYTGQIISFEPVPSSFAKLHARMHQDPLWSGHPFGLSDESRHTVMNTYGKGDFNSLLTLREDAAHAYSVDPSLRTETPIELRRLDSVLPQLIEAIPSPRVFLKIDTQGHDVSVVTGAAGVIDKLVGIQSELPAVQLYEGMMSMSTVLERYSEFGFVPVGFYPVNTFQSLQVSPEFDVLFNRFEGTLKRSPESDLDLSRNPYL